MEDTTMHEKPAAAPESESPKKKAELSTPTAIVLAGLMIAIAIIVVKSPRVSTPTTQKLDSTQITQAVENIISKKKQVAVPPVTESDHYRGATEPELLVVEYSDLECPFCKQFHATMQKVFADHGDKMLWVYRHFPLDCVDNADKSCQSLHVKARPEAIASECAAAQGGNEAFWKFIDRIFEITPSNDRLDQTELGKTAGKLGLDTKKFNECASGTTYADAVSSDAKEGLTLGITGTPTTYIIDKAGNTYVLNGAYPYEIVEALMQKLLAQ